MSEPRVLTTPLGGSALLAEARAAADAGHGWYAEVPRTPGEWRSRAAAARERLAADAWLERLRPAFAPSGAAAARLQRSAREQGVLVTTGQQPGLFGGPIYTWSKALSALALADELERRTGIPTAPVFWAATYDADFAESSVSYVTIDDRVERLAMQPPVHPGRTMRDTPLGDVRELLRLLETAAGAAVEHEVLETLARAYAPGETVGSAYVRLLRAVLEPLGVAVLDAGHPAVRDAMRPLMRRALARASTIDDALLARERELRAAGHEPKVAHVRGLSVVFRSVDGVRTRVPIAGAADLPADAELEPNVLLRPVAECAVLPTVAYVAGPAEIAYFAQSSAVAEALDVAPPLALPRWSGLIVEPHVERILRRYELTVDDLRDPHGAEGHLARARIPEDVARALEQYRRAVDDASQALSRAIESHPPALVPDPVVEGARRSVQHRLARLERRVLAGAKRRESAVMHDLAVARASLFPLDRAQERTLNFIPMLARHGAPLLQAMRDRAGAHVAALLPTAETDATMATHDHAAGSR